MDPYLAEDQQKKIVSRYHFFGFIDKIAIFSGGAKRDVIDGPYKISSKISTFGKHSKSSLKELNFKKIIFSSQRRKNARQPQETTAFVVFEKFSFENLCQFDTPPRL